MPFKSKRRLHFDNGLGLRIQNRRKKSDSIITDLGESEIQSEDEMEDENLWTCIIGTDGEDECDEIMDEVDEVLSEMIFEIEATQDDERQKVMDDHCTFLGSAVLAMAS